MSEESLDIMLRVLLGDDTVRKFQSGMISMEEALEGVDQKTVELANTFATELDKQLKELDTQFAATKKRLDSFKQSAEKLGQISQIMLVAGSAVVGAIYLSAKTEAERIIEAGGAVDESTQRWIATNERLEQSQQRVGKVAVSAVVPLMEKAADLAEKAADFVEKNPELVSAALKIGLVVATLGAVGTAVSKGIRLYADVAFLGAVATQESAALIMKSAAADQLAAAVAQKGSGAIPTPGTQPSQLSGAAKTLGAVTLIATSLIIGAEVGSLIGNAIAKQIYGEGTKDQGVADAALTFTRIFRLPAELAGEAWKKIGFDELGNLILDTSQKADDFTKELLGLSTAEDEVTNATKKLISVAEDEAKGREILEKLAEDQAAAERKYADERQDILLDSSRALEDANRNLQSSLSDIAASLTSNISNIRSELKDTLADLSADFAEANLEAERDYQQQRADIIADGEAEIARIQQQAQKDLEDLEREHARNVAGAVNERDALALVDENQNYQDRKAEIEESARLAIEQARANTEAQLAEAARNYEEQRAQRLAEYEKQKAEAKAQAEEAIADARAKAAEQKKQAEEKYKLEQEEIARKQAEQLEDLRRHSDNERRERVLAANQAITDLGGALNAEAELRRKYYDVMLADANNFMSSYSSALSSSTTGSAGPAPKSSSPGSSSSALSIRPLGSDALRSMVGSKLAQESMTPFGGDGSIVWNDYRTFDADVSVATREAIKMDTLQTLEKAMQNAAKRRR